MSQLVVNRYKCSSTGLCCINAVPRVPAKLPLNLAQFVREPVQAFVETVSLDCTGRLDVPLSILKTLKSKLIHEFTGGHRVG